MDSEDEEFADAGAGPDGLAAFDQALDQFAAEREYPSIGGPAYDHPGMADSGRSFGSTGGGFAAASTSSAPSRLRVRSLELRSLDPCQKHS